MPVSPQHGARYVAFLDDDDLVSANWVGTFRAGAHAQPGAVVRARTALQDIEAPHPGDLAPYRVRSGFRTIYPDRFDLAEHLIDNQSPICSLALPMRGARHLGHPIR